jgi:hypothetical protein
MHAVFCAACISFFGGAIAYKNNSENLITIKDVETDRDVNCFYPRSVFLQAHSRCRTKLVDRSGVSPRRIGEENNRYGNQPKVLSADFWLVAGSGLNKDSVCLEPFKFYACELIGYSVTVAIFLDPPKMCGCVFGVAI